MPSVLTDEGYVVFNTQEEADEFRKKYEAKKQKEIEQENTKPALPMEGIDGGGTDEAVMKKSRRQRMKARQGL